MTVSAMHMNLDTTLATILREKIIAVIRQSDATIALRCIEAAVRGGIRCIEVTTTVPDAEKTIERARNVCAEDVLIGAGTVCSADDLLRMTDAGASFVVSPVCMLEFIPLCRERNVLYVPGCFTPTEIFSAHRAGASLIKLFPASALGVHFIRDLLGPFPLLRVMPTGGVSLDNAQEWLTTGAAAVALGSDIFVRSSIEARSFDAIEQRARRVVSTIHT